MGTRLFQAVGEVSFANSAAIERRTRPRGRVDGRRKRVICFFDSVSNGLRSASTGRFEGRDARIVSKGFRVPAPVVRQRQVAAVSLALGDPPTPGPI
jgi:hypothetical protein